MNRNGILYIENSLNVTLPKSYVNVMVNYPYIEDEGTMNWSLGDNPQSLVEITQYYRKGSKMNPPWPLEIIVIGDEGDGCPIALNLETNEVYKYERGNITKEPLEYYRSFESYVEELNKCWDDEIKSERRHHK
ncbi:hypothetical protein Rhal01_01277 [Rubritalea halochordaticola]|uniref:Knr4/Smi1-like domain-containing protein n=1 Tax=Rubritalea halochordaticola TaxID=714537 RepID=A0ABP9UXH6_9BACT